jgi:GNAT superfamily N-acetyltransferase
VDDVVVIEQTDPRRPEARAALIQYLAEIADIEGVVAAPADADAVDDLSAPGGVFLLVYRGEAAIGCGGVRTIAPGVGELKRMWIRSDERGKGTGSRLLEALIAESRTLGHASLYLDTNNALTVALAMYRKHGFEPVDRYNDNPGATDFLRKIL